MGERTITREMTSELTTISVGGDQPYDVFLGRGILAEISRALPREANKVLVIHPPTLADRAAILREQLMSAPDAAPREVLLAEIPDAEAGKRIEVAAFCWQVMGQSNFGRNDV